MKLVHCSYHKCLTSYFQNVMSKLNDLEGHSYKHFKSLVNEFESDHRAYTVSSVNNHGLDFGVDGSDYRVSRFIRDPRDLVVSGYFYHKRGAEPWTLIKDPQCTDWMGVRGNIPKGLNSSESFSEMLSRLNEEDGLIAQIEFRKFHLESMRDWDLSDKNILLMKYEDIVGNEIESFKQLFEHYQLPSDLSFALLERVEQFSAKNRIGKTNHIRNPVSGQWKNYFTPKVENYFNERYSDLLDTYGY